MKGSGTDNNGYTVLDLSQFVGITGSAAFSPLQDLQFLIRETLPNTNFSCSVQQVPFFATEYTNVNGNVEGLMGPYLPRVDYVPLAQGAGLPEPALTHSAQLPSELYCADLPPAAMPNSPSSSNQVTWPTYWPGTGDWTGEPLVCPTGTLSAPQASPSFVASLAASEHWGAGCTTGVGTCNSVSQLTWQSDAFVDPTPPPVPITIVGTGFGYLSAAAQGVNTQFVPWAGPASSLVTTGGAPLLRIQDCIGGQQGCATWDTAQNPACQVYIANWTDSSITLDVNLPVGVTNLYSQTLSPLSDFSPLTFFFPDTANGGSTQQCPVANTDLLTITVANAQGGGTSSAGPICLLVGTYGPQDCQN
jgi:hypothetical protein